MGIDMEELEKDTISQTKEGLLWVVGHQYKTREGKTVILKFIDKNMSNEWPLEFNDDVSRTLEGRAAFDYRTQDSHADIMGYYNSAPDVYSDVPGEEDGPCAEGHEEGIENKIDEVTFRVNMPVFIPDNLNQIAEAVNNNTTEQTLLRNEIQGIIGGFSVKGDNPLPVFKRDTINQRISVKKPSNPKQAFGDRKPPLHAVPPILELAASIGMREGIYKYGYFNYRDIDVETMTYVAAIKRHLNAWIDGEEKTRDSNIHHLFAVAADLAILLDSITRGAAIDNRPQSGAFADICEQYELNDEQLEYLQSLEVKRLEKENAGKS